MALSFRIRIMGVKLHIDEEQLAITEAINMLEAEPSSGPVGVVPELCRPQA